MVRLGWIESCYVNLLIIVFCVVSNISEIDQEGGKLKTFVYHISFADRLSDECWWVRNPQTVVNTRRTSAFLCLFTPVWQTRVSYFCTRGEYRLQAVTGGPADRAQQKLMSCSLSSGEQGVKTRNLWHCCCWHTCSLSEHHSLQLVSTAAGQTSWLFTPPSRSHYSTSWLFFG